MVKLIMEETSSEQPRIRPRRSRKLRLGIGLNQREFAREKETLHKQVEEFQGTIPVESNIAEFQGSSSSCTAPSAVVKAQNAQLVEQCEDLERQNEKLNQDLQTQLRNFQQMSKEVHARESMLLDAYDELLAEHKLLTSQFHVHGELYRPFSSALQVDIATPIARASAQAAEVRSATQAIVNPADRLVSAGPHAAVEATGAGHVEAIVVARSKSEPAPSPPSHLLGNCSSLPAEFFCPITREVMTDPVLAIDGHTYELEAIRQWFKKGYRTSPMTSQKLACFLLVPNRTLRAQIMAATCRRVNEA